MYMKIYQRAAIVSVKLLKEMKGISESCPATNASHRSNAHSNYRKKQSDSNGVCKKNVAEERICSRHKKDRRRSLTPF